MPVRDGRLDSTLAALRDLEIQELPFPADAAVRLAQAAVKRNLPVLRGAVARRAVGGR